VYVEWVLGPGNNLAVFELENEAASNIHLLAISCRSIAMNGDHATVVSFAHALQFGLEGSVSVAPIPAELSENSLASFAATRERTPARDVPRGVLVKEFGEGLEIACVEGSVTASYGFDIGSCLICHLILLSVIWEKALSGWHRGSRR